MIFSEHISNNKILPLLPTVHIIKKKKKTYFSRRHFSSLLFLTLMSLSHFFAKSLVFNYISHLCVPWESCCFQISQGHRTQLWVLLKTNIFKAPSKHKLPKMCTQELFPGPNSCWSFSLEFSPSSLLLGFLPILKFSSRLIFFFDCAPQFVGS